MNAIEFFEEKIKYTIGPMGVKKLLSAKDTMHLIIDVRDRDTYKKGHIPTAINIPTDELDKNISKLPKDKKLIVYCYDIVCYAAPKVAYKLALKGFEVMELVGGFDEWKKRKLPIKRGAK